MNDKNIYNIKNDIYPNYVIYKCGYGPEYYNKYEYLNDNIINNNNNNIYKYDYIESYNEYLNNKDKRLNINDGKRKKILLGHVQGDENSIISYDEPLIFNEYELDEFENINYENIAQLFINMGLNHAHENINIDNMFIKINVNRADAVTDDDKKIMHKNLSNAINNMDKKSMIYMIINKLYKKENNNNDNDIDINKIIVMLIKAGFYIGKTEIEYDEKNIEYAGYQLKKTIKKDFFDNLTKNKKKIYYDNIHKTKKDVLDGIKLYNNSINTINKKKILPGTCKCKDGYYIAPIKYMQFKNSDNVEHDKIAETTNITTKNDEKYKDMDAEEILADINRENKLNNNKKKYDPSKMIYSKSCHNPSCYNDDINVNVSKNFPGSIGYGCIKKCKQFQYYDGLISKNCKCIEKNQFIDGSDKCICKEKFQKINKLTGKCECDNKYQKIDKNTGKCICTHDFQVIDQYTGECSCIDTLTQQMNSLTGECECKNEYYVFNKKKGICECINKNLEIDFMKKGHCECADIHQMNIAGKCVCKYPFQVKNNNNKCVCDNTNLKLNNAHKCECIKKGFKPPYCIKCLSGYDLINGKCKQKNNEKENTINIVILLITMFIIIIIIII
jgi:hypothetical protein